MDIMPGGDKCADGKWSTPGHFLRELEKESRVSLHPLSVFQAYEGIQRKVSLAF